MLRNWVGAVFLMIAAALLASARRWRRRQRGVAAPALRPSFDMLAGILPPIVMVGLGIAALQVVAAYFETAAGRHFSLFDLIGFLAFLGAYAAWFLNRTTYHPGRQR